MNEKYEGSRSTIICRCRVHNLVWKISNIGNLLRNAECPECKNDRRIIEIKESLSVINPTIKILTDVYESVKTKMPLLCTVCGHEWKAKWNGLRQGTGCPKCKNRLKLSLPEIKTRLLDISPSIEILSKKYIDSTKKLNCRCLKCGHIWSASWGTLSQGFGCIQCAIEKQRGANSPSWKGGISSIKAYLRGTILQWKKTLPVSVGIGVLSQEKNLKTSTMLTILVQ